MSDITQCSRIKLIGGMSFFRKISIVSDRFVATATAHPDGTITSKIRQLSSLKRPYFPKTLSLFLSIYCSVGLIGKTIIWILLFNFLSLDRLPNDIGIHELLALGLYPVLHSMFFPIPPLLLLVHYYIATWHGAEHMAIAAYERSGATTLEAMIAEDTVHPKCGGRLFLPGLVMFILLPLTAYVLWGSMVLGYIALLETLLWIDARIGFDKIPIFAQASKLLQRYITTKKPGEQEIKTAQRALLVLIAVHAQTDATNGSPS